MHTKSKNKFFIKSLRPSASLKGTLGSLEAFQEAEKRDLQNRRLNLYSRHFGRRRTSPKDDQ